MGFTEEDEKFFREMAEEKAREEYLAWVAEQEKQYTEREAIKAWCRWLLREPK